MLYTLRHFTVQEFIPPSIYKKTGDGSLALMSTEILSFCDLLWEHLNEIKPGTHILINNWATGGTFSQRGFRTADMTGATMSEHKRGNAVDLSSNQWTASVIRKEIMLHQDKFKTITRLEKYLDNVHRLTGEEISWVHADCKALPAGVNRIHEFVAS